MLIQVVAGPIMNGMEMLVAIWFVLLLKNCALPLLLLRYRTEMMKTISPPKMRNASMRSWKTSMKRTSPVDANSA